METSAFTRLFISIPVSFALGLIAPLHAADIYWNGTGGTWDNTAHWSTVSDDTTPNPSDFPGASDTVIFTIDGIDTDQTIDMGANRAVHGVVFQNTEAGINLGTTHTLQIGNGGLTIAANTVMNNPTVRHIELTADQTWTNNRTGNWFRTNGTIAVGSHHWTYTGAGGINNASTLSGSGTITVENSGLFDMQNATSFTGTLINKTGGNVRLRATADWSNATIEVAGGSWNFGLGISDLGNLTGTGSFTGLSGETFSVGGFNPSLGITTDALGLTLGGDVLLSLGFNGFSSLFDHLEMTNSSSELIYGGDLVVDLYSGFTPTIGQTFALFDFAGTQSGTFDSITFQGFEGSFDYTTGVLTVVPEPAHAGLLLGLLILTGLAIRARSRRTGSPASK